MNTKVWISYQHSDFFSFGYIPKSRIPGYMVRELNMAVLLLFVHLLLDQSLLYLHPDHMNMLILCLNY